jgi:membrane-bound lytic murein transglycosylase D
MLKTPISKAFALAAFFCMPALCSIASPGFDPSDTTKKDLLLAASTRKTERIVILKEANVEFPSILTGNEEQSIDYIEKFSVARKAYLIRTYNRSKKLFPKAAAILKKYNVPQEFKVLMALESGFNPNAVSSAGAVGYWQFMDEVAREYGLRIAAGQKAVKEEKSKKKKDKLKKEKKEKKAAKATLADDRKNFVRSTHAAARYLKDRGRNLNNDWLLIAASYNCGVGNVWNAMERSGKANPTFWDIKNLLPAETRAYVMNFIALNVVFNNYEKFINDKLTFKPEVCKEIEMEEVPPVSSNAIL